MKMERVNRSIVLVILVVLFTEFYNAQELDIKQTLEQNGNFSRFLNILRKAQLNEQFSGSRTKLTLFAFQNTAYDRLSLDRRRKLDQLSLENAQIFIRAHTMYKKEFKLDSMSGMYLEDKSMNGRPLYFSKKTQTNTNFQGTFGATLYYVNGAEINNHYKNKYCRNGYLHGLLDVMHVPIAESAYMYLSQDNKDGVSEPTRLFKKLVDSLSLSYFDPVHTMQDIDTTLTLFVPSDKAMAKIPSSFRDRLEREEENLYKVIYAHIIPGQAVFTEPTVHNHGFRDGYPAVSNTKENRVIIRKPNLDHVYVNSLRVTAEITNGNLTCRNGVVHIIDKLLGYVFYSVREEISKYGSQFDQIINRANPDIVKGLTDQSQTTVFVPTNEAFQKIANLPWININSMNQNVTNMILRLHMLYNRLLVDMSALTGGYESRQPLESQESGAMLYVYNERNESWVQGGPRGLGGVKAKVVDPDVACTNGQVNYIDAVLGVPYLDIPMLICDDMWLLKTYDYIKTLEMTNYIKDRRFDAKKCYFEQYGYPPNWGNNNQYVTQAPYPQFWNPPTTTQRSKVNTNAHNMGFCGQNRVGCTFTFFVPNSTAIDKFQARREGQIIMQDYPRFQFLFRRLLFPTRIILGDMSDGSSKTQIAHNGDYVTITKSTRRNYEIIYKQSRATVIHADQAATNGVIHIISDLLYDRSDLDRDVSRSSYITWNTYLILLGLLLSLVLLNRG